MSGPIQAKPDQCAYARGRMILSYVPGYQSKVFEENEKSPKLFSQWYSSGIGIPTMKQTRTHEPAGGDVRDDPDSHVRNAHQP